VFSVARDILLTPYERRINGLVVGIAVQHNAGIAIEARICAILPELRTICIGVRDAVQCENGNREEELDHEEAVHQVGIAPVSSHEKSRHLDCVVVNMY
jgi:hypothetical protein